VPSAQKLARELLDYFGSDQSGWQKVQPLAQIVGGQVARGADDDITLFKALGMGISDLSLGMELYDRAIALGLGRRLPPVRRVAPRLKGRATRDDC
jgi:ornithine cyclodeaminase